MSEYIVIVVVTVVAIIAVFAVDQFYSDNQP